MCSILLQNECENSKDDVHLEWSGLSIYGPHGRVPYIPLMGNLWETLVGSEPISLFFFFITQPKELGPKRESLQTYEKTVRTSKKKARTSGKEARTKRKKSQTASGKRWRTQDPGQLGLGFNTIVWHPFSFFHETITAYVGSGSEI